MKLPAIFRTACLFLVLALPCHAQAKPPVLEVSGDWLIISFTVTGDLGTDVVTVALRKSAISSITIHTDFSKSKPEDAPKNLTPEQIQALPAHLTITTTERNDQGGYRYYAIGGLTHATAPAFMKQVLAESAK